MEVLDQKLQDYVQQYASALDPLLLENERDTWQHRREPHMISGQVQGKVLEMLSLMIRPKKILEIGTFTGFSALCLAKGLEAGGKLHTIELREEDALNAAGYFEKSDFRDQIILHIGNAKEIIPTLVDEWDIVFIDADKTGYIDYYELTLPRVRKGGWIIADNVLFHGDVLHAEPKGKNGKAVQAFNDHIKADGRIEHVLVTVRDGLMLIRKK
jgi:predicted O-methyltransferase YrrM